VDIEITRDVGGGYYVGWIDPGEWLAHNINSARSGHYRLVARTASALANREFHIEIDGVDVTGPMFHHRGSNWQDWVDVEKAGVYLTKGPHTMKIVFDDGIMNINYIDLISN